MKKMNVMVVALVSVLVLIFAVSSFLLIRGVSQFSKEEKTLERSVKSLRNYYARNPFPSAENVKREATNSDELRRWMAELATALRDGQIEPIQKTPAQFLRLFSQTREDLKQRAGRTRTALDDTFAIGFERYAASGTLPAPADVPRLAQQLVIADQICRIVFDSGATRLSSLRREEFEASGAASVESSAQTARTSRRRRTEPSASLASGEARPWTVLPDAGMLTDDDLYARLRFGITFEARQDALLKVMNGLAADDMFAVVSLLRIEKTGDDVTAPPSASTAVAVEMAAGEEAHHPPRSERLMCGPMIERPMRITMEIDVYRFAELTSGKEA